MATPAFDPDWYLQQHPDVYQEGIRVIKQFGTPQEYAKWHFEVFGKQAGYKGWSPEAEAAANAATAEEAASDPIEKSIYDQVLPSLIADIEGDEERRTLANELAQQAARDYQSQRGLTDQALGPSFDSDKYFAEHPDVAEAYARSDKSMSPEAFGQNHYDTVGKDLGYEASYTSRLQREYANADATAQALEDSAGQAASEQLAALQAEIEAMRGSLDAQTQAKADALQEQINALTTNIDSYDAAQKAALTEEITKLTAAQLPVSQARVKAAEDLVTGINLGLQQVNDRLASEQAKQGYLGGSSSDRSNLARAAIGARQQAASVLGQANVTNAEDMRSIGAREATEGRGIAGSTAQNRFNLGTYGAGTTYGDTLFDAEGRRTLADELAKGTAGIENNRTTQAQAARNAGAGARSGYFDADYQRRLATALTLPSLTSNLTQNLSNLENYGNSGLNRSLGTLNWWAGGGQAPSAVSPNYQAYVDQTGSNIAGLGTGLFQAAISTGNANKWWQTPKPKTGSGSGSGAPTDGVSGADIDF